MMLLHNLFLPQQHVALMDHCTSMVLAVDLTIRWPLGIATTKCKIFNSIRLNPASMDCNFCTDQYEFCRESDYTSKEFTHMHLRVCCHHSWDSHLFFHGPNLNAPNTSRRLDSGMQVPSLIVAATSVPAATIISADGVHAGFRSAPTLLSDWILSCCNCT